MDYSSSVARRCSSYRHGMEATRDGRTIVINIGEELHADVPLILKSECRTTSRVIGYAGKL